MKSPLFREEVLAESRTRWLGTVLLTPHLSYGIFATFALLTTLGMASLLYFGSYTRRAKIDGWLVPQRGLVQVFAPQAGVVTKLSAVEGATVRQGEPLLVLSNELQSVARGAMQTEIASRLEARRTSLVEARAEMQRLAAQQATSLRSRIAWLKSERAQLDSSIALQRERVALAKKAETRQREVHERGLISDQELQTVLEAGIEQQSKLRELTRSWIASRGEQLSLEGDLRDLPLKSQTQLANVDRDIAQVEQELAETEARREIVVPAPESGTVTSVQAEQGARADPNVPLLSIVPAGSKLEAHLYSPSRSIGFMRAGQKVLLRYEAYPYQKFGHYDGVIASISRSAVNPAELPAQLAGMTSLTGSSEPVYRIVASLERQTVNAYGKPVPLQPGMTLSADVFIEKRRLIEWVLDPLYTLTGK